MVAFKKNVIAALDQKDRAQFTKRLDELFNTEDPKTGALEDGKKTWGNGEFLS
ncbi:MAG: hypothetical protein IPO63_18410 [Bacteroidetes bacterium]|nr:hypothetical protein [Bacteroidota bacterium]